MARKPIREDQLAAALDEVARLDVEGLRLRWRTLYGTRAPPTFRARLLHAALAYKLQEQIYGGLKPSTRRLLRRVADEADRPDRWRGREHQGGSAPQAVLSAEGVASPASTSLSDAGSEEGRGLASLLAGTCVLPRHAPSRIKPGTRLLRTWQGTTHEVLIGDTGVIYRGQPYRSLSEVARVITGQRWSGPLFFGLKRRAQGAAP